MMNQDSLFVVMDFVHSALAKSIELFQSNRDSALPALDHSKQSAERWSKDKKRAIIPVVESKPTSTITNLAETMDKRESLVWNMKDRLSQHDRIKEGGPGADINHTDHCERPRRRKMIPNEIRIEMTEVSIMESLSWHDMDTESYRGQALIPSPRNIDRIDDRKAWLAKMKQKIREPMNEAEQIEIATKLISAGSSWLSKGKAVYRRDCEHVE